MLCRPIQSKSNLRLVTGPVLFGGDFLVTFPLYRVCAMATWALTKRHLAAESATRSPWSRSAHATGTSGACCPGCVSLAMVHVKMVHVKMVHVKMVHVKMVHFQIVHFQMVHVKMVHVKMVHVKMVHIKLVHVKMVRVKMVHIKMVHVKDASPRRL